MIGLELQCIEQQSRLLAAAFAAFENVYLITVRRGFELCSFSTFDSNEGQHRMGEIASQDGITIDVGFGNITFCRDEAGTFAQVAVEIIRRQAPCDKLKMSLRVTASHHDPLAEIVERSRVQILEMLRGATDRLDQETAETLIYPSSVRWGKREHEQKDAP